MKPVSLEILKFAFPFVVNNASNKQMRGLTEGGEIKPELIDFESGVHVASELPQEFFGLSEKYQLSILVKIAEVLLCYMDELKENSQDSRVEPLSKVAFPLHVPVGIAFHRSPNATIEIEAQFSEQWGSISTGNKIKILNGMVYLVGETGRSIVRKGIKNQEM